MTDAVAIPGSKRLRAVPPRLLGDERLLRLAAGGDSAAFAAIFERHYQPLYRYCRSILGT